MATAAEWSERGRRRSCGTAEETAEWIREIVEFMRPYEFLINAHVVNFFTHRQWECIDSHWIDCLRHESVSSLLLIPSGTFQTHWPSSLKLFLVKLRSLAFPRDQADLRQVFPGLNVLSLNSVLSQGMNRKKKHEVEVLSAVVSYVAKSVNAHTVVDVGAGQGYLAQVLAFEYQHSVLAIDASFHHGRVTDGRAERIRKHYAAQMRKLGSGTATPNVPRTVTCKVMSIDMLKGLANTSIGSVDVNTPESFRHELESGTSLVLAGLHACGDLSVTMLKTFAECKEIKAVVSIGCCYNLLSEECFDVASTQCGFPMSRCVKSSGIALRKNSRDLACQSAERWRSLGNDDGVHNFELHAFRAAFQMVLCKYHPETVKSSPSVGRQGKTLRRQQQKRAHQRLNEESKSSIQTQKISAAKENCPGLQPGQAKADDCPAFSPELFPAPGGLCNGSTRCKETPSAERHLLFEKFCLSGLSRLGIDPLPELDVNGIWNEVQQYADLIGPYWSIRAALGPLLETLILLDRLLFLQEQDDSLEMAVMLPIFDPVLSPRNVAIIGKRV